MPNFTKGKWRIADYIGVGWDIVDERGFNIAAQVCEDDDARLIAAAPEMYDAVSDCADVLQALLHRDDCNEATDLYQVEELIHDLWDLLARIDGKEE